MATKILLKEETGYDVTPTKEINSTLPLLICITCSRLKGLEGGQHMIGYGRSHDFIIATGKERG